MPKKYSRNKSNTPTKTQVPVVENKQEIIEGKKTQEEKDQFIEKLKSKVMDANDYRVDGILNIHKLLADYPKEDTEKIINLTDEETHQLILHDFSIMKAIEYPSDQLQEHFLQIYPNGFRLIRNPSELTKINALSRDGSNIIYIKNPSEKEKMVAVRQNPLVIRHIPVQSSELQMIVAQNTKIWAFHFIINPSESVRKELIIRGHIDYIIPLTKQEQILYASISKGDMSMNVPSDLCEEAQLILVKKNVDLIHKIKNPSIPVQQYVAEKDPNLIKWITDPDISVLKECSDSPHFNFDLLTNEQKKKMKELHLQTSIFDDDDEFYKNIQKK